MIARKTLSRGDRRDRAAWTLVLAAGALLALSPSIGLVSPRSRNAAEPPSESNGILEHEPPPSPLVAPRPPRDDDGTSPSRALPARESAWRAEDAGRGPSTARPASMNHAPDLARLEVRVTCAGRPAPGALLELLHEPREQPGGAPALHRCDELGRYVLELAPGVVRAVAWSADACALPASAVLEPGASARLELALEPSFPVAGRVVDERTGAPIEGASVALWTFAERDAVTTGPDGRFLHPRFPARAPAQQLAARATGYGVAVRYLRLGADGSWKLTARTAGEETLRGTGTPWVELALVPELVVRGRTVDGSGRPIAGARVSAEGFFHAMPSVASRDLALTESAADGSFELAGLRSDVGHSLLLEAAGFAHELRELAGGATLHDPGALVLLPETVLAGVVIDASGSPIVGVEVVLRGADSAPAASPAAGLDAALRVQGRERRATTTPEGAFLFEHLAPRPVTLAVEAASGARVELELGPRPSGDFEAPCLVLPPPPVELVRAPR